MKGGYCWGCLREVRQLDRHHIYNKGNGGCNDARNLIPLCRGCHSSLHSIGRITWFANHPHLKFEYDRATIHRYEHNKMGAKWKCKPCLDPETQEGN